MTGLAVPAALSTGAAAAAAIEWTSTINLGAVLLGLLIAGGTLGSILYGVRFRVGYEASSAAAEELRKGLADSLARGERLEQALATASSLNAEQAAVIQRLENLPNLERIVHLMAEETQRADERATQRLQAGVAALEKGFDERLKWHDERAQERHDLQLSTLAGLAASVERLSRSLQRGSA